VHVKSLYHRPVCRNLIFIIMTVVHFELKGCFGDSNFYDFSIEQIVNLLDKMYVLHIFTRVEYVVDHRNTIFARVWTPGWGILPGSTSMFYRVTVQVRLGRQGRISWDYCNRLVTGRMPYLSPNQQRQSTEGLPTYSADLLYLGGILMTFLYWFCIDNYFT